MNKKKVYISYDYENERHYKNLLLAWNTNEEFESLVTNFEVLPKENLSELDFRKSITDKISQASVFLVIVGKNTHQSKWVKWEIEKAKELDKKIVAVKSERENTTPKELYGIGANWAMKFTFEAITNAINRI
ncbi:MAG: TIR domain-containing protein [Pyrinomonadaceae bacterium]|nr:TIR domain-containing protein [Pyrinomonadaceae bacterium]